MLNHTTYRYNLEIYTDKSNNIIHSLENRMLDQTMETFNLEIHNVKSNTRNICIYIYILNVEVFQATSNNGNV